MMEPIYQTHDLNKQFGGGGGLLSTRKPSIYAVRNLNLRVMPGQTLGIVGESGCGKSTLARMMVGLDSPTSGWIAFHGQDLEQVRKTEERRLRTQVQFVFQDPLSSLNPRKTIRQILETPLKHLLGLDKAGCNERVQQLMDLVNLRPEFVDRYPHEFSGGQAQRIGVARALAARPEFVVLDEPVSALDVSVQAQVLNLLRDLKKDLDLTYMFISHDLAVVENLCDTVAVMYLGRVVEMASRRELFQKPCHPYTRILLASVPVQGKKSLKGPVCGGELPDPSNPPLGCSFEARCAEVQEECKKGKPSLVEISPGHEVACFQV